MLIYVLHDEVYFIFADPLLQEIATKPISGEIHPAISIRFSFSISARKAVVSALICSGVALNSARRASQSSPKSIISKKRPRYPRNPNYQIQFPYQYPKQPMWALTNYSCDYPCCYLIAFDLNTNSMHSSQHFQCMFGRKQIINKRSYPA